MLVLTRKEGESVIIQVGEEKIEITLKEIRGNSIRLGIDAEDSCKIIRKELVEEVKG